MKLPTNLKGTCPYCDGVTIAGNSCCEYGAVIGDTLITDEDVWDAEREEDETLH